MDQNNIGAQRIISDANIESQSSNPPSIGDGIKAVDYDNAGNEGRQYYLFRIDRGQSY